MVRSQLVLERGAFFGEVGDAIFGLVSDLADGLGDQLRVLADLLDLVDDESFDLSGGDRWGRALVPAALLGGAADVVAMSVMYPTGCARPAPAWPSRACRSALC